jgi:hypothetical protein
MVLDLGDTLVQERLVILKMIALLACVIGFVFLGPKAVAEFLRARPRTHTPLSGNADSTKAGDKPGSDVAA